LLIKVLHKKMGLFFHLSKYFRSAQILKNIFSGQLGSNSNNEVDLSENWIFETTEDSSLRNGYPIDTRLGFLASSLIPICLEIDG